MMKTGREVTLGKRGGEGKEDTVIQERRRGDVGSPATVVTHKTLCAAVLRGCPSSLRNIPLSLHASSSLPPPSFPFLSIFLRINSLQKINDVIFTKETCLSFPCKGMEYSHLISSLTILTLPQHKPRSRNSPL